MRLILLALGLAAAAGLALWAPLRWLHPDDVVVLEGSAFAPDSGHAFLAEFAGGGVSDQEGRSALRLREDGRELVAHTPHDRIRSAGNGCFSHWGEWLYVASSDNSDPRTNGRRYDVLLPARASAAAGWLPGLLLVAAVVAAGAGARREARARKRLARAARAGAAWRAALGAGLVCAFACCVAWSWWRVHGTQRRLDAISASLALPEASEAAPAAASPPPPSREVPSASARPSREAPVPRVTRLLDDPEAGTFAAAPMRASASPPAAPPDLELGFPARASLPPGELLACATPLDLALEDVSQVLLPLRATGADRLLVRFQVRDRSAVAPPERHVDLELPLQADGAEHTLQLDRPLRLAREDGTLGADPRVVGLQLGSAASAGMTLELELHAGRIVPSAAEFARATHGHARLAVGDSLRPAWWQSAAGETAVALPASAGGRLRGAVALCRDPGGDAPASYRLEIEDRSGARRSLATGQVRASQGWCEIDAALPPDVVPARLVFGTDDLPAGAALAWSALRRIDTSRAPRRVLMLLADTLRADAVGCFGGARDATPALDGLAAQGACFTECYSQSYWTRPSVPSILTGRYVAATGVSSLAQRVPESLTTLAERFAAAGFHTVAYLSNANGGPAAGLDQGFDEVCLWLDEAAVRDTQHLLLDLISPRLPALQDDDLFVYVHLMEAHGPYGPPAAPPGWRPVPGEPVVREDRFDPPWSEPPTAESRRALYRADVAHLDAGVGAFLERWLGAWDSGAARPAVVALVADHGECLGEGGRWGHGWSPMLAPVLHVPLILRAPGAIAPGTRCDEVVQNVDVGETLLALGGVAPDGVSGDAIAGPGAGGVAGRSLLPLLAHADPRPVLAALASAEDGKARLFTVITSHELLAGEDGWLAAWQLPTSPLPDVRVPAVSQWDLAVSPEPAFLATWARYLQVGHAWLGVARDAGPARPAPLDPAALQQLRTLGYLGR